MKILGNIRKGIKTVCDLVKKRDIDREDGIAGIERDFEDDGASEPSIENALNFSEGGRIAAVDAAPELKLSDSEYDQKLPEKFEMNFSDDAASDLRKRNDRRQSGERRNAGDLVEVKGVWYISNLNDLKQIIKNTKRPKIVLRGDLTFYVLDKSVTPGEEFVRQDPRVGAPALKSFLKNDTQERIVHVWVRKTAIEMLQAARIRSVTLEIDQLLRYGSSKKSKLIVLTSWRSDGDFLVQAIVFSDGFLEAVEEQRLNAARFNTGLKGIVTTLRRQYQSHDMVWVDPIEEIPDGLPRDVRSDGAKAFQKLANKNLIGSSGQITLRSQFKRPALIVAASVIAYTILISFPYQKYADEKQSYLDRNISFRVSAKLAASEFLEPGQLTVLEKKRFFMTDPREQTKLMNVTKQVISEVNAIKPKIWITNLKLGGSTGMPNGINLVFRLDSDPTLSATAQVEPIIRSLSKALGISLGSTNQGIRDQIDGGKAFREVSITGAI